LLISTKNKQGFSVVSDYGDTVALDVNLTAELVEEGLVREIISKEQTMRKYCDFVVTDHILIGYFADEELAHVSRKTLTKLLPQHLLTLLHLQHKALSKSNGTLTATSSLCT
ncbi:MAG: hypothetical protein IJE92_00625, partial [Clostridia bacterium]|nr:hypothetical protein [Clostridia bacterium]